MLNKPSPVKFVTSKPKYTDRYKEVSPSSFKPRHGKVIKNDKPKMMKTKYNAKGMNIPTAKMGSNAVMDVPTFKRSKTKNDTKKIKYNVGHGNTASAQKKVKAPKPKSKTGISRLPKATLAGKSVDKMGHGSRNLANKKSTDRNIKPTFAVDQETTRPSKAKKKTISKSKAMHIKNAPKPNQMKMPTDAPAIPVWESVKSKANVVESVVMTINGKPKMDFPLTTESILSRLAEQYEACGYHVDFYQVDDVYWKNDEVLMDYVYECVNTHYHGLYETSADLYNNARYRLAQLCADQNNSLCESHNNEFEHMITSAINEVHKAVEEVYLSNLVLIEGVVRIDTGENIVDVDIQTHALNEEMALRLFRNEIVETYGFNTKIMHVFIDGDKYSGKDVINM